MATGGFIFRGIDLPVTSQKLSGLCSVCARSGGPPGVRGWLNRSC